MKPMDPEEFRRQGHLVIDFIADYYKNVEKYPVRSQVEPGYLKKRMPDSAPYDPEPIEQILRDVQNDIVPGITHWQSPNYYAYFPSSAEEFGVWVHVDAAYAGSVCICPEYRHFIDGVEKAHSFSFNAHKWFLTTLDCCCLWVKEPGALVEALSTYPEYLRNKASETKQVVDYKDWQITLSRRFRSLKLWMVLRSYGVANLRRFLRSHVKMAKNFEGMVGMDKRFEVVVPRNFATVCFRIVPVVTKEEAANSFNARLLERINEAGEVYMTHAVVGGEYVMRFAVGASLTENRHVILAWKVVQEHADALLASS
ncbi:tyrosine/dopa decarboxylase 5 [Phtheirospermum japonicum]|uniref:Tyrosine/dopa decarboxylase 5 n=1 Tax=Phtheirospermum japonicum TaxID=374723 RepID=A0A830B9Q2_9LAMI|nr:tyrosine/dopa decarboxylase 5 [Phtheirospermum japonicum]